MRWISQVLFLSLHLFSLLYVEANKRGTVLTSFACITSIGSISGGAFEKLKTDIKEATTAKKENMSSESKPVSVVFSDVDGTLVHYPNNDVDDSKKEDKNKESGNKTIYLPASSTGMRGVISSKTLQLCQKLRREEDVSLVLVSGMRTATLIKRLPYLPKADAYASEAGGRIFYSVPNPPSGNGNTLVTPVPFDGATDEDLAPFGLVEDDIWRSKLSSIDAAGLDGYVGDSMDIFLGKEKQAETTAIIPMHQRKGALWDLAKDLQEKGFVIDCKGYTNCFRVNKKQQNENISGEKFDSLCSLDVSSRGLASSVNLGCVDFYPIDSGKKNW